MGLGVAILKERSRIGNIECNSKETVSPRAVIRILLGVILTLSHVTVLNLTG